MRPMARKGPMMMIVPYVFYHIRSKNVQNMARTLFHLRTRQKCWREAEQQNGWTNRQKLNGKNSAIIKSLILIRWSNIQNVGIFCLLLVFYYANTIQLAGVFIFYSWSAARTVHLNACFTLTRSFWLVYNISCSAQKLFKMFQLRSFHGNRTDNRFLFKLRLMVVNTFKIKRGVPVFV